MGGRKTLISGRVMSSGYIPPVSSKRARRSRVSELSEKRYQRSSRRVHRENYLHSKPVSDARKIPNRFYCGFGGGNFYSRVCVTLSSVRV